MKVATSGDLSDLDSIPEAARTAEELGYDIFSTSETNHNPFIPLTLAAEHTQHMGIITNP